MELHRSFAYKPSQHAQGHLHLCTIPICSSTKFLGLTVDCSLSWSEHIELVTKKLSTICYLIRNIKPYLSNPIMKMIYHSLFHSVLTYGIIFWGNSPHSSVIFKMQKRAIRTIMGCGHRESCRKFLMELKILPLASQYIFSLLLFVVNNRNYFNNNNNNIYSTANGLSPGGSVIT